MFLGFDSSPSTPRSQNLITTFCGLDSPSNTGKPLSHNIGLWHICSATIFSQPQVVLNQCHCCSLCHRRTVAITLFAIITTAHPNSQLPSSTFTTHFHLCSAIQTDTFHYFAMQSTPPQSPIDTSPRSRTPSTYTSSMHTFCIAYPPWLVSPIRI